MEDIDRISASQGGRNYRPMLRPPCKGQSSEFRERCEGRGSSHGVGGMGVSVAESSAEETLYTQGGGR